MNNILKYLYSVFYALLFCIGITFFITQKNKVENLYNSILRPESSVVTSEGNMTVDEELYVNYSQLIATLMNDIEYEIEIDNLLIKKEDHNGVKNKVYTIKNSKYSKSYIYENGMIQRIVYKSI